MLASLPLAGCGSSKGSPGATVPRPTTSTTISVATVPAVITVAYAQAVMDELDKILGDAIRELVASKGPSDAFVARLKAVYAEPQYSEEESVYGEEAAKEFKGYRIPPGDPKTRIVKIVGSSESCLIVRADRSFADVFSEPPTATARDVYIDLRIRDRGRDPTGLNPTAWSIRGDGPVAGATVSEHPCSG